MSVGRNRTTWSCDRVFRLNISQQAVDMAVRSGTGNTISLGFLVSVSPTPIFTHRDHDSAPHLCYLIVPTMSVFPE